MTCGEATTKSGFMKAKQMRRAKLRAETAVEARTAQRLILQTCTRIRPVGEMLLKPRRRSDSRDIVRTDVAQLRGLLNRPIVGSLTMGTLLVLEAQNLKTVRLLSHLRCSPALEST
eukprot:CAMPEP_0203877444 /NCGR_PEP_ID=MMETSP0359-20131031/22052_1 /ASSEMBLY_ACC=CAM_ASM_000338 /TAXON_ID=268821 /ORGANISM="Scrippsiella Hangoei, Strain SHTV-5" /LENGTH=115 /DNA_ID=CAMNT_0050796405 /DNA_START=428 /DNA_END=771 /DNA_ORIENTATION=-